MDENKLIIYQKGLCVIVEGSVGGNGGKHFVHYEGRVRSLGSIVMGLVGDGCEVLLHHANDGREDLSTLTSLNHNYLSSLLNGEL